MRTRIRPAFVAFGMVAGLLVAVAGVTADERVAAPRLDRIDYAAPAALPSLSAAVGAGKRTQGVARQLAAKGKDPVGTLSQIVRWVGRNLRVDESKAQQWRTVDQILVDGKVGGEADHAMVVGVMARLAGIPTAWVKTLPVAFVRGQGYRDPAFTGGVGRTFLEVHVAGGWRLLDPVTARLHRDYHPSARVLPDDHLAFDKGADPHALVLPNRPGLWRAQVQSFAGSLPVPKQPWSQSSDLLAAWRVYVTGRGGAASYASAASKTLGFLVEATFESKFDEKLAEARGKTLIVTCRGRTPVLPESLWSTYLPPGHREILSGARPIEKGWIAHRLSDGTRVILIVVTDYGPVELAVSEALEG